MDFVAHICKNKDCNNIFVAEDYTKVKDVPPHWRFCPNCCDKLGIEYDKQKPWTNYSEARKKQIENLKNLSVNFRFKKKVNI